MSAYPRYAIAPGSQYPVISTDTPSQYPVIELVDASGDVVTNIGNGPADGVWTSLTVSAATPSATFPPMYMKDSRGVVHARGKVTADVANTVVATFPAGHIPVGGAGSLAYFAWGTSANGCNINCATGALTMLYALEADLSVITFPTVLS